MKDTVVNPDQIPAQATSGLTTRVVKGSLWTLAGQVAPLAVALVTTPFVIRMLGAEGYGVLILIALIPSYFGFVDFGMSIASTKFGSEAYAEGDPDKEAGIVRTSALISFMSSFPVGAVMFAFSGSIIGLFNVPEYLQGDASLALKFASVTFVVNFLSGIFNTPQLTRLRMDLNTFVNSGFRILGLIAVPLVVFTIGGVAIALFAQMIIAIMTLGSHILVSRALLSQLFVFGIDTNKTAPLLRFGGGIAITAVATLLLVNAEKLVLTKMTSVKSLAYYSVAFTLATMATMFSNAMIQSLIPAFSQLLHGDTRDGFNALFQRSFRINLVVLFPLLTILCVVARPFFTVWAGDDFGRESTLPFYILLLGLLFNLTAFLPYCSLTSAGRSDILAKLYWIQLTLYIVVVVFFVSRYGIVGAAIAWSLRVITDAFVLMYLSRKYVQVSFGSAQSYTKLLVGVLMFLPSVVFALIGADFQGLQIAVIPFILLIYSVFVWKKVLDEDEKVWFRSRFAFS